jgi:serine/threonine-protein kinase HipA
VAASSDLNPFPDRVRELKTWISAETGPDATIEALLSVAPYFKIPLIRAKKMAADVEHAVARWRAEGRSLGMTNVELESFAPAFEHSERDAARGQKRRSRTQSPPRTAG